MLKKVSINLVRWVFGVFFSLIVLVYITESPAMATAGLICALLLIPPIERKLSAFVVGKGFKMFDKAGFKVVVFLIAFVVMIVNSPEPKSKDGEIAQNANDSSKIEASAIPASSEPVKASEKPTSTPKATPTPKPTPEPTREELIDAKVREMLKDKYVKTEIDKEKNGRFTVYINYTLGDNLSNNLIKVGYYKTVTPIYKELFAGPYNVDMVVINGVGPLKDKYGNESVGTVYNTSIGYEDGSKVNWKLDGVEMQMVIQDVVMVGVNLLK
jgi:hypothetical protein